ncbi:MAG TPA: NAD(P)-binding domain-containing protein, partial [Stellaceae bacterium]|nr:NAD(P)-binding domain-containing protein [Stellaceae bacterium]
MSARIGFLGTGLMGSRMTRNLLAAGFPLVAWNRSRAKAAALVQAGATVAASPAEAVIEADIVIAMLANGPSVELVLFGESGAAAAISSP